MLPFLNAYGRPAIEFDYSGAQPYSSGSEVAGAAAREMYRIGTLGAAKTEWDVISGTADDVDPDYAAEVDRDPMMRYPGGAFDRWAMKEASLPTFQDKDEIRQELASRGITTDESFPAPDVPTSVPRLMAYHDNFVAQKRDEQIMANAAPGLASTVAKIGGGLAGALADPLNFIPIAGAMSKAKAGATFSRRFLAGAKIGAVEGAAGAAIADTLTLPQANEWGADYGWGTALADVTLGGILGSALGGIALAFGGRKTSALHQDALTKAAADIEADRAVDVSGILERRVSEVEASGSPLVPNEPRMIVSEHPYGWNGPDIEISPTDFSSVNPVRWAKETPDGPAETFFADLIVRNHKGRFSSKGTSAAIRKNSADILEGFSLPMVATGDGQRAVLPGNNQTGWEATIGRGDLVHMASFAKNEDAILAIQAAPELWRTAKYIGTDDWRAKTNGVRSAKSGDTRQLAVHSFANEFRSDGRVYDVKITVRETPGGKNYYNQTLSIKKEPGSRLGGAGSSGTGPYPYPVNLPSSSSNIAPAGDSVNGRSASFEAAGPDADEVAARTMGQDFDRYLEQTGPISLTDAEDSFEVDMAVARVNGLADAGAVAKTDLDELADLDAKLAQSRREQQAYADAVECVLNRAGGLVNG